MVPCQSLSRESLEITLPASLIFKILKSTNENKKIRKIMLNHLFNRQLEKIVNREPIFMNIKKL